MQMESMEGDLGSIEAVQARRAEIEAEFQRGNVPYVRVQELAVELGKLQEEENFCNGF